jgi:hypothetical protein
MAVKHLVHTLTFLTKLRLGTAALKFILALASEVGNIIALESHEGKS